MANMSHYLHWRKNVSWIQYFDSLRTSIFEYGTQYSHIEIATFLLLRESHLSFVRHVVGKYVHVSKYMGIVNMLQFRHSLTLKKYFYQRHFDSIQGLIQIIFDSSEAYVSNGGFLLWALTLAFIYVIQITYIKMSCQWIAVYFYIFLSIYVVFDCHS